MKTSNRVICLKYWVKVSFEMSAECVFAD